jgi:quinol monooxygenase YgiN
VIFIVAKFDVKPEYAEGWLDAVDRFTQATRAEPGNLWFDWSRSTDHPNRFVLVEAFRDGDAGGAHVRSEHFRAAMQLMPVMLAHTPQIINVEVPGDSWSRMGELAVD